MSKSIKSLLSLLIVFILLLTSLSFPLVSYADDEEVQAPAGSLTYDGSNSDDYVPSIQKDFFMGIFHKKVTNGDILPDLTGESTKQRQKINYEILNGSATSSYSLYDRFGGNITFPIYLGEEPVLTGFADKIYEYYTAPIDEQEGIFGFFAKIASIAEILMQKNTFYTNEFYDGRPQLKNGNSDPRVILYKDNGGTTILQDVTLGTSNYLLDASKLITGLTTFFISDGAVDLVKSVIDPLLTTIQGTMSSLVMVLIGVLMAGTVAFVAVGAITYFKSGQASLKELLIKFFGALLSLGLISAILISPTSFANISYKVLKFTDNVTSAAINMSHKDDEIISSSVDDNVVAATLWKQSIFLPWVNGTFGGKNYDELYTTYSDKPNQWTVDNDTALSYGNISVKRGGNEEVKNWAALAYSCSSIYHIDSVEDQKAAAASDPETRYGAPEYWPKAKLAGDNKSIYVDDFRWIDAYLKVGQYEDNSEKLVTDSYVDYNLYAFDGISAGGRAIFLSILLLPLLVVGVKKFASIIICIGNLAILLWRSLMNIFNPNDEQYNILSNIRASLNPFISYLYYAIVIFVLIYMYELLAPSSNPVIVILYIGMSLYLMLSSPESIKTHFDSGRKYAAGKAMLASNRMRSLAEADARGEFYSYYIPDNLEEMNGRSKSVESAEEERRRLSELRKELEEDAGGVHSDSLITIETYREALNNDKVRRNQKNFNIYYRLNKDLDTCVTNRQVERVLLEHRKRHRDLDNKLGIADYRATVSNEYNNESSNRDYDFERARRAEAEKRSMDGNYSVTSLKRETINEKFKAIKAGEGENYDKLRKKYNPDASDIDIKTKMLKDLRKEAKRNVKKIKFEGMDQAIKKIAGKSVGGSFLSLEIKLYIALGILILFVVIYLFYIIVGL